MSWRHIVADTAKASTLSSWRTGTKSSSRACSTRSPLDVLKRIKWLLTQQDSDLVIGVSVFQDRKRLGNTSKSKPASLFANGEWDKLASVMISEHITSKHLAFMCSNMHQTGMFTFEKGKLAAYFQIEPENNFHAREYGFGVQSTLLFSMENGFSTRCQFSFLFLTKV